MPTDTEIQHAKSQFIKLFESMGLDPIETLGPDRDKTVRMIVAHGKAYEREERQRVGKLLQFRA
jgi:hypothetical protein